MKIDDWEKAKKIFGDAIKHAPELRSRYLDEVCADDVDTRREVESLLFSYDHAESFMETPVAPDISEIIEVKTKKIDAGKCFGHYEIIKQIGAGGMGEVYLAKDKKLDRKVAVKILNEKFAKHESNLNRFIKEAKAASALNHPNILVIHEIGVAEDAHYIISEFIEGKTLREVVNESAMKLPDVLDIAAQIANALTAAHATHLVHRDIKPENIMVRPDGYVKVLDFGLAKLVQEKNKPLLDWEELTLKQNQTSKGIILGTVEYMSPEQAKGLQIDERTDIFSLGVLIYEMIAGRTPFAGDLMSETFANLINAEPRPLPRSASDTHAELQRIIFKMLRKNKEARYQTMKELLGTLKNLQEKLRFERNSEKAENRTEKFVHEIQTDLDDNSETIAPNNLAGDLLPIVGRENEITGHEYKFVADVHEKPEGAAFAVEPNTADPDIIQAPLSNAPEELPKAHQKSMNTGQHPKDKRKSRVRLAALIIMSVAGFCFFGFYFRGENTKISSDAPIKIVAVLPFKPLLEESRDEALEMGMADTLISKLGNNRKIIVRPLSSVRRFGNLEQDALAAGRELSVDSVLDGSIQRLGDNIRVNARLIKVADGTLLWTGTFEEKFTDIFIVQDTISQKVAVSLALQLGADEQKRLSKRYTENVEAYQFYLRGRFLWNKRTPQDLQKSIEYFEQAIALDPGYALAYTGIADTYSLLANAGSPPREFIPKAREAVLKALSLDNDLAEAHSALGQIFIYYDYDYAGAEREHKRAIELNPNYATAHQWYSELLTALGRHEEALAEMRRALEIEPLSLIINRQYGVSLVFARKYDDALAQLKRTIELDANFALAHSSLSMAYRFKSDYAASVEEYARYMELIGENQSAAIIRQSFAEGGWQGFLRAMIGQQRSLNLTPYNRAIFYAALDEKDQAFRELNTAYQNRETVLGLLKVDPRLDSLRDDSRFAAFIKRMNFE
jgi:serine/threonine protein kinase/TolB-like protein